MEFVVTEAEHDQKYDLFDAKPRKHQALRAIWAKGIHYVEDHSSFLCFSHKMLQYDVGRALHDYLQLLLLVVHGFIVPFCSASTIQVNMLCNSPLQRASSIASYLNRLQSFSAELSNSDQKLLISSNLPCPTELVAWAIIFDSPQKTRSLFFHFSVVQLSYWQLWPLCLPFSCLLYRLKCHPPQHSLCKSPAGNWRVTPCTIGVVHDPINKIVVVTISDIFIIDLFVVDVITAGVEDVVVVIDVIFCVINGLVATSCLTIVTVVSAAIFVVVVVVDVILFCKSRF